MEDSLTLWIIYRLLDAQRFGADPRWPRDVSDNEKILSALSNLIESSEDMERQRDAAKALAEELARKAQEVK